MTSKKTSAAVFASLWTDAKYLRLQARKDAAIRAARLAEFYRASDPDRAKLDALRRLKEKRPDSELLSGQFVLLP